jgi:hypothetical protein
MYKVDVKKHVEDKPAPGSRLSKSFHDLKILAKEDDVSIKKIRDYLGQQGHAFLILILSLPFLTPIPLPGLSTVFGLIIFFVSLSWAFKKAPWIPQKWLKQKVSSKTLFSITNYGEKISKKIEFLIKPRFIIIFEHFTFRILIATILCLCALFLALPLPPGTNFPPAITLFVVSLSIIEEDLYAAILGILIFAGNIFIANQAYLYIASILQA